jgi:hypothetical protein
VHAFATQLASHLGYQPHSLAQWMTDRFLVRPPAVAASK